MRLNGRTTTSFERSEWAGLAGLAALLALALIFSLGLKFKTAAPARTDGPPALPGNALTIVIARDGVITAAGRALTPPQLEDLAREEVASHGGRPERVTVVLLVDSRARSAAAIPVLDRLKRAGVSQVQIALNPRY